MTSMTNSSIKTIICHLPISLFLWPWAGWAEPACLLNSIMQTCSKKWASATHVASPLAQARKTLLSNSSNSKHEADSVPQSPERPSEPLQWPAAWLSSRKGKHKSYMQHASCCHPLYKLHLADVSQYPPCKQAFAKQGWLTAGTAYSNNILWLPWISHCPCVDSAIP